MKYSAPLPDEPSRLARHRVTIRGQFSGASGSSPANLSVPARSSATAFATGSPKVSPSSSGLRSKVGYEGIQPVRADRARQSAPAIPASRPSPSGEASTSARNRS